MCIASLLLLTVTLSRQIETGVGTRGSNAEAQRLQAEGQLAQARDSYERALVLDPGDTTAQQGMASTSERLSLNARAAGDMNAALETLVRAQKAEPDNQRVLLNLGILEDEMALDMDAVGTLEHLVALKPTDPNAFYALARVDLSLGRLEAAEMEMRAYLKIRPLDASAHYGLGRIYLQGLLFDKARDEFEESIRIQPKQSEGYYQLGQTDLDQNKLDGSIVQFKKALERNSKHGGALVGIGTAYFKLKQYDKAKEWLARATEAAPEYQPGHYYLGLTLARLGDAAGSQRELDVATHLAAKDTQKSATRLRLLQPKD